MRWLQGATRYTVIAMTRPRIRVLSLAFAVLLAAGCGGGSGDRPNVLLITIDTLRPDRLGAYGYDRIDTSNIDALAAAGALFEYAVTDTPWTTPSMDHRRGRVGMEWLAARQHFIEDDAGRVEVRAMIDVAIPTGLLGAHVDRRTHPRVG